MSDVKGVSAESVEALDAFAAILDAGRMSFAGKGILPTQVMSRFVQDLAVYDAACRTGKDLRDAKEQFAANDDRPYVHSFLEQSFAIADAAAEKGIEREMLAREIGSRVTELFLIAVRVKNDLPLDTAGSVYSEVVWQRSVASYPPKQADGTGLDRE